MSLTLLTALLLQSMPAPGTATALDAKGYDAQGHVMFNGVAPVAERHAEPIRPDSPNAAVRAIVCQRQGQ